VNIAHQPVSSPSESLILVDDDDREIGFCTKAECHTGDGLLHRAFSVFLFNSDGQLLIQQRSEQKPLWPLFWSNSCCSHPRRSETVEDAAHRRVLEELNLTCELQFLYKFKYHARYLDLGSEHEFCRVFAGYTNQHGDGGIVAHPDEIADWRFVEPGELSRDIDTDADRFSPWLKMEWRRIQDDFLAGILTRLR
jgi:isopentenyl-diphosphate delta-isomerase